ncbi:MAG: glycolate oxidase subunit GlcE [Burkholderiales bacterium]|nr:glycolate oxidase subunit GlcE [Burkholderiales bacterium]
MQHLIEDYGAVIRKAASSKTPLCVRAGGSKDFYGGLLQGQILDITSFRGIVDYDPSELVLTARAGTPLAEIESALGEHRQMLAFEPPHYGAQATLGGTVACGFSGPRAASSGTLRDFVLGVRVLDGNGKVLRFGGQVMKNVAGYDVSRVMTGALGTLGVLLEISLKVLPLPAANGTLRFELPEEKAIQTLNQWAGLPLPISATAYNCGELGVRLSGAEAAVEAACKKLGGERVGDEAATAFWIGIREHTDAFFQGRRNDEPMWRLSIKSTTPPLGLPGRQLFEWRGALRWLISDADSARIRSAAETAGGHATLFRSHDKQKPAFHPLSATLMKLHLRLKQTFDPHGILNRGRLYPDF